MPCDARGRVCEEQEDKGTSRVRARSRDDESLEASERKRRRSQENRRDLLEKTKRALDGGRLDHIPKSVWTMKRDAKGLSIEDRVYDELEKNAESGKYISSRF